MDNDANYYWLKETERSKEAFMDMLATRYPQYAEKISSTASEDGFPVRGRSRDPRRRATTVVYTQQNRSADYDDIGTMSEVDAPTFQRGGYVRSSLPARSPQPFVEKPIGLVFLVYGNETKKALLPNEITHLDTVRALFVRSFPGKLTMEYLDSPKNKIYILDPRTNIYYQLEDLKDIKDRTVLKIHQCDSTEPQKIFDKPEVRGRTIQTPTLPLEYHGVSTPATAITGQVQRAKTLPASMQSPYFIYEEAPPSKPGYDRSRSLTPDPSHVSYAQNPIYGRMGVSPERTLGASERQGLRTIPENRQMMNGHPAQNNYVNDLDLYQQAPGGPQGPRRGTGQPQYPQHAKSSSPSHQGNQQAPPSRRAFSPLPSSSPYDYIQVVPAQSAPPGAPPNMYIAKGVPAGTVLSPQRATGPQSTKVPQQQPNWRERSPVGRHSLNFATVPVSIDSTNGIQRSQSYRVTPDRENYASLPPRSITPQPVDDNTRVRINKMEAQLAHLAAWVQSAVHTAGSTGALSSNRSTASTASIGSESTSPLVDSASSSLTDLGSEGTITQDMKTSILAIKNQADLLRFDLKNLRRLQQINKESIIETVEEAWKKIKKALAAVPGAEKAIIRQERASVDETYQQYMEDKNRAERELVDLEASVEELRNDVLSRQCRVNMSDVEGMALILSHIAKKVGELKNQFPSLQERMKQIMAGEMEIVVKEERFLKEEPEKLENCLKRCKRLTGTLFTLKRLASVQEHRPPQTVSLPLKGNIPSEDDKKSLLENIQALIPNHDARLQSLEAADASRQRKKKITTQKDALRFGKSLEMASKALKPATSTATSTHTSTRMITSSPNQSSQGIKVTSSAEVVTSESSSIISFSNPISTSTPKATPQAFSLPISSSSLTSPSSVSPSKPYPIVSLIRAVSPRRDIKTSSLPLTENVERMSSSVKPCVSKEISDSSSKSQTCTSEAKLSLQTTSTNGTSESSREISEETNNSAQGLITKKNMARAAFFSSLSSSHPSSTSSKTARDALMSVSPEEKTGFSSEMSPVSPNKTGFTQISSITKPSDLKVSPSSSIFLQSKPSPTSPTEPKSRSGFTGIPKPTTPTKPKFSALLGDLPKTSSSQLGARPKKVPPPPPPRRSSRHASLTGSSVSTVNGDMGAQSTQSMEDSIKKYISDSDKEENSVSKSLQETETISKVNPLYPSSDLKILGDSSVKLARFSKDLDLGINGDGQQVESTLIRETIINGPEEKTSNETVPKDSAVDDAEQNVSKSLVSLDQKQRHNSLDSTSSSSSIDSQPEVVWLRREPETPPTSNTDKEGMPGKKPRPPLPQRRSSLSEKSTYFSKKDQLEDSSSLKQICKDKGSKENL
ncbi:hypothetical protein CHS0354_017390 [Potamilus streckersoni]|uniref:Actin interacting protein 3-like C-terminal domain-containing protein n=1 Tax=Potamilus streckersoni TaxID=2493646 RepID=A0AAE0T5K4_9BIVA|nr:hypothetical protein CHS0354_017390 [Potamilus streckersoni]